MEGLALQSLPQPGHKKGESHEISPSMLVHSVSHLTGQIATAVQTFWNIPIPVRLFGISKSPHYYWHMQDFYVVQKGLDKEGKYWGQLRISEDLCRCLFETTLGKLPDEPAFTLEKIRNFEVFLLERFSRRLFQLLSPILLKRPDKKRARSPSDNQEQMVHMVWVLKGRRGEEEVNQLIFTLPEACIKRHLKGDLSAGSAPVRWTLPDELFMHADVEVTIRVGITRTRLEELKQLEPGDIIILEESVANQLEIQEPSTLNWLKVQVSVPERFKIPDLVIKQGMRTMTNEMKTRQSIWDNLPMEVTATFNPVRMPLKQLKEIEQGLVIEIGDLMDNRLQIEVEGQPIAWGELLVLGDKFCVRIEGLHESAEHVALQQQHSISSGSPSAIKEQTAIEKRGEEDSDSLSTEENFMDDLDLDESDFDDLDTEENWN